MAQPVLDVADLRTWFHTEAGIVRAVDGVTFRVAPGRTLGIVGESGSGKSVTSLTIMGLIASSARIESGKIALLGRDLVGLPETEWRRRRGNDMSMIFQEPMTSLNPVFTVGAQVMEAILLHQQTTKGEARQKTLQLFSEVGIQNPAQKIDAYPHQLSGGQKQRVMIAMALSCNPQLLIADEPTTALDVTIQKQILDMLRQLRDQRGMAMLFITHDLGVIGEIADDVLVMYRGKMVEFGPVLDIFSQPKHPYTKGLLACRPRLDTRYKRLPTVDDFMETTEVDGRIEIIEKQITPQRLGELCTRGRGRLLHPQRDAANGSATDGATWVDENARPLVEVRDLQVYFPVRKGLLARVVDHVRAVDGVSFCIYRGQTLGLVGESGCGKTTTGRAILRLIEPTAGSIVYDGRDVASLDRRALRSLRARMQIIFQDPYGSLNPRMTVEAAVTEPMMIHGIGASHAERRDRAADLLKEVGLPSAYLRRYPHEFSGGQRQRICIARALAVEPEFVVCDEAVSALDVSVQAQVLNLLKDLQEKRGLTYLFISHDLSVVKFMADMMAVMNDGRIVEFGPAETLYRAPQVEYTKKLINATPNDAIDHIRQLSAQRAARNASPVEGAVAQDG